MAMHILSNVLPCEAAIMSGELLSSFTAFTLAPFLMSFSTTFSSPTNELTDKLIKKLIRTIKFIKNELLWVRN